MRIFLLLSLALLLCLFNCGGRNIPDIPAEKQRALANELFNRELYPHAIEAYKRYLDNYSVSDEIRANVLFTIGTIYFERIRDYENALAAFITAKNLYPDSPIIGEVNKRIIASLERLDRSLDAQQALSEAARLDESQVDKKRPGEVVARIGEREITQGDLDFEIRRTLRRLPPEMRPGEFTKEQKLHMLRQHLTIELLFNTARRMGLEKEKEVIEETFEAKKMIMASLLQQREIENKVTVTDADIKLYYTEHMDEFAEKDEKGTIIRRKTLEEAWNEAAAKVHEKKAQQALDDLIERAMKAENVQIFQEKIK